MIWVGYILLAMLGLRFLVVLVNFLSRPFLAGVDANQQKPLVSVLIPARNEELTLPLILSDLLQCGYPNLEVIVCNDHSTDGTLSVLNEYKGKFPNLNFFDSLPLPGGWIGKNFACHQLAQKARGKFYLFLDADVRVAPGFIDKLAGNAQKKKLALLSLFPRQVIGSLGEWYTVPLMNWILLSYLPLPLVRLKWFSSLSAANGQVMFFDANIYMQYHWHERVKGMNVEDIIIARMVKKNKLKLEVLLGNRDVSCRMYENYRDAVNGFSRNIHQYFSGSRAWLVFFVLISWLRIPLLWLILGPGVAVIAFFVVLFMKLMVSLLSGQSVVNNFRFHLNQLVALSLISHRNIFKTGKGHIEWKGREYTLK